MQRLSLTTQHFLHSFYPGMNRVSSAFELGLRAQETNYMYSNSDCHLNYLHLRDLIYERIVKRPPLWLLRIK